MREIKFRAWDESSNQMSEWFDLLWLAEDGGRLSLVQNKKVMQFTGLKDKNNKEIYEGDIMKFFGSIGKDQIDVIEFRDGVFDFKSRLVMFSEHPSYITNGEVIGNIYENPELLKQN